LLSIPPANCIVFEDAPKGVEAAEGAGMDCIALTNRHEEQEFKQYSNIIRLLRITGACNLPNYKIRLNQTMI